MHCHRRCVNTKQLAGADNHVCCRVHTTMLWVHVKTDLLSQNQKSTSSALWLMALPPDGAILRHIWDEYAIDQNQLPHVELFCSIDGFAGRSSVPKISIAMVSQRLCSESVTTKQIAVLACGVAYARNIPARKTKYTSNPAHSKPNQTARPCSVKFSSHRTESDGHANRLIPCKICLLFGRSSVTAEVL